MQQTELIVVNLYSQKPYQSKTVMVGFFAGYR